MEIEGDGLAVGGGGEGPRRTSQPSESFRQLHVWRCCGVVSSFEGKGWEAPFGKRI